MNGTWGVARNILLVRLDGMGDLIMTTPAISAIRTACPGSRLTLLTSPQAYEAAKLLPTIDRIVVFDAPWIRKTAHKSGAVHDLTRILVRGRFDAAILFTVYSQSSLPAALLAMEAGIPLRLGYSHENPYDLLTDWIPDPEPVQGIRHEVRRQLDLVASVGYRLHGTPRLSLTVPPLSPALETVLAKNGLYPGNPGWILVHPGASEPMRRYPARDLAAASAGIASKTGLRIVLTGSSDERRLSGSIAHMVPHAIDLSGMLSFPDLVRIIYQSPLVITNNTGVSHVAAATGTPQVVLYADTNPQHTPWESSSHVLHFGVPCKACMRGVCGAVHTGDTGSVSPQKVVDTASELLSSIRRLGPQSNLPLWNA